MPSREQIAWGLLPPVNPPLARLVARSFPSQDAWVMDTMLAGLHSAVAIQACLSYSYNWPFRCRYDLGTLATQANSWLLPVT